MSKMTDEQIKKALEVCSITNTALECKDCHYNTFNARYCSLKLCEDALDLINRQQAEIEKLNVELVGMRGACNSYKMHYDNAKAEIERLKKLVERQEEINQELYEEMVGRQKEEVHIAKKYAIKEFAERLKKFMHTKFKYLDAYEFEYVTENDIDNLVKEMVGEGK